MTLEDDERFDDYANEEDDVQIDEYDITATPNDFNVITLFNFIESGAVRIPGFQRNFVWDHARSSKLIESLILGLPVPQLFLYEQARNKFLVIDGQQRLMSIYYFIKKRFPRKEKRVELRYIFDRHGGIPDTVLHDDNYFQSFSLKLPEKLPQGRNKFKGLNYSTLGEFQTQLDLRPIRNVIVKQNSPANDDSSMYEVFNRLNTGGINLRPQEIRTSMYHSDFYEMMYRINSEAQWRRLLRMQEPDLHMKDIEVLLRAFAMMIAGDQYAPSLVKFLNHFSRSCGKNDRGQNDYLEQLFRSFLASTNELPDDVFINKKNKRFNIALFEAVFAAACEAAAKSHKLLDKNLNVASIVALENDEEFTRASLEGTTNTANVKQRLDSARRILAFA
jgi:uncharacterized protein with ParB-like and HNH nuclease domain